MVDTQVSTALRSSSWRVPMVQTLYGSIVLPTMLCPVHPNAIYILGDYSEILCGAKQPRGLQGKQNRRSTSRTLVDHRILVISMTYFVGWIASVDGAIDRLTDISWHWPRLIYESSSRCSRFSCSRERDG